MGLSEVSEENYLLIVKLCSAMYFPCLHLPKSMYLKCATGIKRFVSFVTVARYAEVNLLEVCKQVANSSSTTLGVAMCCHTATSERGRGWVGYLPSGFNARSEASQQAFARVTIHRQDPLHQLPHFGANFTRSLPRDTLDLAYDYARHDIFLSDKSEVCFEPAM